MVGTNWKSLGQQLLSGIFEDVDLFKASIFGWPQPGAGLYTYRVAINGGQKRLHLRVESDGTGVLFVDVTDVIHLNPTATRMAKLALDGVPYKSAKAGFSQGLDSQDLPQMAAELTRIYELIKHFQESHSGCPTCTLEGLDRSPLFSRRARAPYKVDLALTYGCNNQCPHCYNEPDRFNLPSLSTNHWFRVIDKLYEIGVPYVIFTGGEATLHPELSELIQYADSLGMITGLNSNGRRLADGEYVSILSEAGLNHVQITLGSSQLEVHDLMMGARSFDQTVRGIENIIASNIHCITNTTLTSINQGHITEFIDFIYQLGVRTFAMNGMIYSGGGFNDPKAIPETEMTALLIQIRDHAKNKGMRFLWYTPTEYCRLSPMELEIGVKRCNAAEYSLCIEPTGDVLPCQSYYVVAGNILRDRWQDIWQSELFLSFRDREKDPRWAGLPEKCWTCPDLPLCGSGCRIEREARSGKRVNQLVVEAGCSGCSVSHSGSNLGSPGHIETGFLPFPSTVNTNRRSTGNGSTMIPTSRIEIK